VALHARLKRSIANEKRARSMYELYVRQGLAVIEQFETTQGSTGYKRMLREHVVPSLYRVASIACAVLSVALIWCECTIMFDDAPFNLNLSPVSHFFRFVGTGGGGFNVLALLALPILYCAFCTYFAMFRMKLFEGMTLHPNGHSDASSLLFNATYACRLGPPLCYNFLKLLHERDDQGIFRGTRAGVWPDCSDGSSPPPGSPCPRVTTYFTTTAFGDMAHIAVQHSLGNMRDYFSDYAPLLIVVICGGTYLNLGSGLMSCCSKCLPCLATPVFSFDEDFSDTRIDHGAAILQREKRALADGVPLGTNLQLLSGATSDDENARVRGTPSSNPRFNRLRDDQL